MSVTIFQKFVLNERNKDNSVILSLGIPIAVVSKLLGHADIATTQIYAKITDNLKVQEIAKFDAI